MSETHRIGKRIPRGNSTGRKDAAPFRRRRVHSDDVVRQPARSAHGVTRVRRLCQMEENSENVIANIVPASWRSSYKFNRFQYVRSIWQVRRPVAARLLAIRCAQVEVDPLRLRFATDNSAQEIATPHIGRNHPNSPLSRLQGLPPDFSGVSGSDFI
jgi:hypothetical protein